MHVIRPSTVMCEARPAGPPASARSALSELAHLFMIVLPVRGLDSADDLREEIERIANASPAPR